MVVVIGFVSTRKTRSFVFIGLIFEFRLKRGRLLTMSLELQRMQIRKIQLSRREVHGRHMSDRMRESHPIGFGGMAIKDPQKW